MTTRRKNGCFDHPPFKESMVVQDGHYLDGYTRTPRLMASPFRMEQACQYTLTELGQVDESCRDCIHKKEFS